MKVDYYKTENLTDTEPKKCLEEVGSECGFGRANCGFISVPCPDRVQRAIAYKLDEISKKLPIKEETPKYTYLYSSKKAINDPSNH